MSAGGALWYDKERLYKDAANIATFHCNSLMVTNYKEWGKQITPTENSASTLADLSRVRRITPA
jgi:hypothetical protein